LDLVQEKVRGQALASEVGETLNIAVLSGGDALYLDQVVGPSALSLHNWVVTAEPWASASAERQRFHIDLMPASASGGPGPPSGPPPSCAGGRAKCCM